MKRLVYRMLDGTVRILIPINQSKTVEQIRESAERKDPSLVGNFISEIDDSELPSREFRNQWRLIDGVVNIDSGLENVERWERIRKIRNKLLEETDGESIKSIEKGNDDKELKNYRQALRDITKQQDPKNISWPQKP